MEHRGNGAAAKRARSLGCRAVRLERKKRISREELSAILYRYAALKGYDVTMSDQLSGFADRAQISSWALESTRWAVGVGLIQGKENGRLDPSGATSRAEGATILARFTQSYGGLNKDPED